MGSYEIVPNLYVIFIGPPAVIRKSTTTGYAEDLLGGLLGGVDGIHTAATAMSKSKLIEVLSEISEDSGGKDTSISILSSEFSNFINVSKEEMYDLLTDLYDGKVRYEYDTRLHSLEVAEKPCVNLLAATTPDWIDSQPPEHIAGGGFSSRVIFIFEDERRRHQLYYDEVVDESEIQKLGSILHNDLVHISDNLEGEFRHDSPATKAAMEKWYQDVVARESDDERVAGYFNRKHVHAHKVAMLLSVAKRDDLIVTMDDFNKAKGLLSRVELKMPKALAHVGKNPYVRFYDEIAEFIEKAQGPVGLPRILARFHHQLQTDQVKDIILTLKIIGRIKQVGDDQSKVEYIPT